MEDRKVLLSVKDLIVKFHVRGRVLTAIRGVSLDIYENESIAIVGESGSGKSVFTKTFAGMLDSNGFIDNGKIIFSDEELSDTVVKLNDNAKKVIAENKKKLDEYSRLEFGADTYKAILELESEKRRRADLSKEEAEAYEKELLELKRERTNTFNLKQTYDPSKEKDKIKEAGKKISELDTKIRAFEKEHEQKVKERANSLAHDTAYNQEFDKKMAGLKEVPVVVKEFTDQEIVEISLIENIQREDLNPIEEAMAYKRLMEEFHLKQDEIADRVAKSRTAVTNSMRLLKLSAKVQEMVIADMISAGHARALLGISDEALQETTAMKVFDEKLSVRETEKLVKNLVSPAKKVKTERNTAEDAIYESLEEKMKGIMGTKVSIQRKKNNKGKIEIEYYSRDELERIIDLFESIR